MMCFTLQESKRIIIIFLLRGRPKTMQTFFRCFMILPPGQPPPIVKRAFQLFILNVAQIVNSVTLMNKKKQTLVYFSETTQTFNIVKCVPVYE